MVLTSKAHSALLEGCLRFAKTGRARLGPLALEGDVPGLAAALRAGRFPMLVKSHDWPLPGPLRLLDTGDGPERLGVTDEVIPVMPGVALMRPPSLLVGIDETGHRKLPVPELRRIIYKMAADFSLSLSSIAGIQRATEDRPGAERAALIAAGATGRIVVAERDLGDVKVSIARRIQIRRLERQENGYAVHEVIKA
jgi:hypothetical protein